MKISKNIPRTVFQLGLVSLFNDMAKEMIYPVVPLFLAQVLGAGPAAVGWVGGCGGVQLFPFKDLFGYRRGSNEKKKTFSYRRLRYVHSASPLGGACQHLALGALPSLRGPHGQGHPFGPSGRFDRRRDQRKESRRFLWFSQRHG